MINEGFTGLQTHPNRAASFGAQDTWKRVWRDLKTKEVHNKSNQELLFGGCNPFDEYGTSKVFHPRTTLDENNMSSFYTPLPNQCVLLKKELL